MITVDRIFQIMNEQGITAKEFALNTDLSQGNITDWKTGRARPSTDALLKISKAYNVSIEWLVGKTYFKNEIEHMLQVEKTIKSLCSFKKNTYDILDKCINIVLLKKSDDELDKAIEKISTNFNEEQKELAEQIFKTLYYDYKESKDVYKMIYGIDQFSIDSFLQYSILRYPESRFSDEVREKLNEIKVLDFSKTSNVFPTPSNKLCMCPVYGHIAAGVPNWAEQCMEGTLPLDPDMMHIHNAEECFFLRVSGESMNKVVKNGGYALIRKQEEVENGEIAVVLVNGYDATLKKFNKKDNMVILEPMSDDPTFQIQLYGPDTPIQILGKYIGKFEMN